MRLMRLSAALLLVCTLPPFARGDAVERMKMEKLRAAHEKVEALKQQRREVGLKSGYQDVRALLHVHSAFSHDSRAPIEEIVDAANKVAARVVMFTEHPDSKRYDYINDGHQGWKDGVLLIPGAETGGFLAYPKRSIQNEASDGRQGLADLVRGADGLIFLSHLEERMDWEIKGLTGTEIYNTHADFKDEPKLLASFLSPLTLLTLMPAIKQYPQEVFSALHDYPADYLARWDFLCTQARHTGVSANDAHHNQGFRAALTDEGKIQLADALGKKLALLDPEKIPLLKPLVQNKQTGDTVIEIDLDPYERSFRHVSTHLLLKEIDVDSVWAALTASRAYVAFDWIADPTGFVFQIRRGDEIFPIGAEIHGATNLRIQAEAPLEGTFKLVRDGKVILEQQGTSIDVPIDEPGNYRVEVWQTLAAEPHVWVLTNPMYVRAQ